MTQITRQGECANCETQCLTCQDKPKFHRDMETIRYKDSNIKVEMPISLAIRLSQDNLSKDNRHDLLVCIQEAE